MNRFFREESKEAPASFGARYVGEDEKFHLVRALFDRVSPRYDLMNDAMSLGWHRLWKSALVDALLPAPEKHCLDLAGGTGDVAFGFLQKGGGRVIVCDASLEMIRQGQLREKSRKNRIHVSKQRLCWVLGDGEALPFADASFDAVSLAFGLRNMTHIDRVFAEIHRVLKPMGRFACLEFNRMSVPFLHHAYRFWLDRLVPSLGRYLAGDEASYRYLKESIDCFPDRQTLLEHCRNTGFQSLRLDEFGFGLAVMITGVKFG